MSGQHRPDFARIFRPATSRQINTSRDPGFKATKTARPVARAGRADEEERHVYEYIEVAGGGTWTWRSRKCLRFSRFFEKQEE